MASEESIASLVGVTLDRFIKRKQSAYPGASGELSQLLRDIALASKIINREINRAGLTDVTGAFGFQNTHGEHQQKLDMIANVRFVRALRNGGECCAIISEEDEDIIHTGNVQGKYVVAMDPLDGSSNIDVNVSIGIIFSIYRRVSPVGHPATLTDFVQGGRQQVAAGYVLYGSSTILVYTTGQGVNAFTYEQSLGEYFLSHPDVQTPVENRFYSVNESNFDAFAPAVQQHVLACRQQGMSARYIGSLVGDYHRNMLKGASTCIRLRRKRPMANDKATIFMKFSRQQFLRTNVLSTLGFAHTPELLAQATPNPNVPGNVRKAVKITAVKPYVFRNALYVKIETDAGISGWGEGDHERPDFVGKFVTDVFAPILKGQDPFDSEHLWTEMFFDGFENGSTGLNPGAVAGVDNALWDLKGRLLEMPVSKLLGANKLEKIAVYGSYGRRNKGTYRTPPEMAKIGQEFVAQGYKTIKARMQLYDRERNPPFAFTYDCIREVRKAVGDNIDIFVDFNNGYTAGRAIELGLKLYENFNIKVIEEPVSSMNYPDLRQVVEALPCEVNAGQHEYNKWQFRDLIVTGNPDCLNLDLIKSGGLSECRKIAGMAHAFDKEVMVQNTRPTLATAASLNLVGSIANSAKVQEFSGLRPDLDQASLFNGAVKFEDGFLFIPTGAGLGLTVNEAEMERRKLNK